jgi:tRNA(Ile)-lysidine synthase
MTTLAETVLRTMRRHALVPPGGRVLVALSGGADSVGLLHILLELETRGELVVAGAAHFNHQLRGEDADADERFCAELAGARGLPFQAGRADVREKARLEKRSIEDAARAARYAFLRSACDAMGGDAVAVGHTRDDQAETFLLRLLRGAGSRGLAGIRPKAGLIIRPLLDIRRLDLRDYIGARGLRYREDVTNADLSIPRNRVRHELIPYLERAFSPGIVDVLAREAASAREDEERLQSEAIELTRSIVLSDTDGRGIQVDAAAVKALPPALAARGAGEALAQLGPDRFVGAEHIQRFLDFIAAAGAGAALSLPGQQAVRDGHIVRLRPEPERTGRREGEPAAPKPRRGEGEAEFRFPLSIPGEVVLASQGWAVSAAWAPGSGETAAGSLACFVQGPRLPLAVRSRRPGDRFHPPGMGGRSKKLQDYFVDRKVTRSERDLLPLVVDGDDRIVWVVGHGVSEDFRAAAPSNGVIFLTARHLGGEV